MADPADPMASLPPGFVVGSQPSPDPAAQLPPGFQVTMADQAPQLPPGMQHPIAGPSGDTLTDIGRRVKGAATDALAGMIAMPRAAAGAVDWLGNKAGVDVGADKALASIPALSGHGSFFPDYPTAKDAMFNATGNVEYQPQTLGGRMVQQGLTTGLSALAGGGLRAVPAAIGGGAAAEGAQELAPQWAKLPAALAAFAGGSKLGAGMAGLATRVATAPFTQPSDLYQAYQRQGVPTTLAGDVTQHPTLQFAQAFASRMPGGEETIRNAAEKAMSAWQDALNNRAATLGSSATMQDAGVALQSSAQSWLSNFKAESNRLWGNFKMLVPGNTPVPVTNFQQTLGSITQQFGGADGLAQVLQPKMAAALQEALKSDAPKGVLSWQAVQAARSRIGEMLESPDPIADTGKAALKQIYGALSQDMKAAAAAQGQNAAAAFDKANAYTAAGHGLLDDHITPILNATNPETAAQYAMAQMRLGGSRVAALDQALPGAGGELGAVALRQAAANGPGRFPAAMADNRISPEAKSVLFGKVAPDVDDLTAIANAQKKTAQMVNHSNTNVSDTRGVGRLMTAAEAARLGGHVSGGDPMVSAGAGALGFFSPEIAGGTSRMLATNPLLARLFSTPAPPPFGLPGPLSLPGLMARYPALANPIGVPQQ